VIGGRTYRVPLGLVLKESTSSPTTPVSSFRSLNQLFNQYEGPWTASASSFTETAVFTSELNHPIAKFFANKSTLGLTSMFVRVYSVGLLAPQSVQKYLRKSVQQAFAELAKTRTKAAIFYVFDTYGPFFAWKSSAGGIHDHLLGLKGKVWDFKPKDMTPEQWVEKEIKIQWDKFKGEGNKSRLESKFEQAIFLEVNHCKGGNYMIQEACRNFKDWFDSVLRSPAVVHYHLAPLSAAVSNVALAQRMDSLLPEYLALQWKLTKRPQ